MASSSANQIPLFFFFFFFLFLLQIHARDSRQFFSKTTREPATETFAPSETITSAYQDTPTLTPQTHNDNGYGLYGTTVGTYSYNGGHSRPADHSQESSEVYSYRKQSRPIDNSNWPSEFENKIDRDAQSSYSAHDDERNYKYPYSRSNRWKGKAKDYGVYNYNGGTSGAYYESTGSYGHGTGAGYKHNNAMEEEYRNKNQEMEENQEEFTP